MQIHQTISFRGGLADYEDKGVVGSFKFATNADIRKPVDSLSATQALKDEGLFAPEQSSSISPSSSSSPSSSVSPSPSNSPSPSASGSPSPSVSGTPSASMSPSHSTSSSSSVSPSSSTSPSPSPSAGYTSIFRDLIRFFVKCSDGNTYGFGNTGKIYKRTSDANWSMVYDCGQEIKGAFEKPSFGGNTYLIWATNTDLHRKIIPGATNWSDVDQAGAVQGDSWPKTNLTGDVPHTMNNVGGDILICNGPMLAMAAYDDSYTNEALDLIPGNIAKTIVERSGHAITGTYRVGDPDQGINAAIDSEQPLAQVGDGNIFYADMTNSIAAKQLPGGGRVNPGGITNLVEQVDFFDWQQTALSWINKQVVGNLAVFGVYNAITGKGGIYTYGRKNKNQPFVLNLDYLLDVDEIGAVTTVNGVVLASYQEGSEFGVKTEDPERKAIATYEGLDVHATVKLPTEINNFKYVELYMAPLPSGCSVEFWYRMNKLGDFVQANTADGQIAFTKSGAQKAAFSLAAAGDIYEPRIVLNPSGNTTAEVYRQLTYYQ